MKSVLKTYVDSFVLGQGEQHRNMTVFPIMSALNGAPEYLTLKEALETGVLVVTEVSEGGSVPNLKVANKGDVAVLLLDGEELAGAKQNRVLNTTILVKGKSEIVVPVSCVEHGRWGYVSREFSDSGNVLAHSLRKMNKRDVACSLATDRQFRSDQGAVWNELQAMEAVVGIETSTGAMSDVFEAKTTDLEAYLKAFTCGAEQKGILVMIGGAVAGFDFVSREKAFAVLFPKLIKSYAMEAWLLGRKKPSRSKAVKASAIPDLDKPGEFLTFLERCEQKTYPSVGLGTDVRFDGPGIIGSALMVDGKVLHMAVFSASDAEKAGNMAGLNRRRAFRT